MLIAMCADDAVKIIRRQTIENIENINTEVGEYCRIFISGQFICFVEKSWILNWHETGPVFHDVCRTLQTLKSSRDTLPNTLPAPSKVVEDAACETGDCGDGSEVGNDGKEEYLEEVDENS